MSPDLAAIELTSIAEVDDVLPRDAEHLSRVPGGEPVITHSAQASTKRQKRNRRVMPIWGMHGMDLSWLPLPK